MASSAGFIVNPFEGLSRCETAPTKDGRPESMVFQRVEILTYTMCTFKNLVLTPATGFPSKKGGHSTLFPGSVAFAASLIRRPAGHPTVESPLILDSN